jgi:hypothetical protein
MRLWNVGEKDVEQFCNSKPYVIKANSMVDLPDDVVPFLLSRKDLRGKGVVQVREGDNKAEKYEQARINIYNWNRQICNDYNVYCEERKSMNLQPDQPHAAIIEARRIVEEYDKWVENGKPIKEELKDTIGEKKTVYACPYCNKEFGEKIAYFGHIRSHQKEDRVVHTGSVSNKSEGEG